MRRVCEFRVPVLSSFPKNGSLKVRTSFPSCCSCRSFKYTGHNLHYGAFVLSRQTVGAGRAPGRPAFTKGAGAEKCHQESYRSHDGWQGRQQSFSGRHKLYAGRCLFGAAGDFAIRIAQYVSLMAFLEKHDFRHTHISFPISVSQVPFLPFPSPAQLPGYQEARVPLRRELLCGPDIRYDKKCGNAELVGQGRAGLGRGGLSHRVVGGDVKGEFRPPRTPSDGYNFYHIDPPPRSRSWRFWP